MLIDYFGKDHQSLMKYLEEKDEIYPITKSSINGWTYYSINLKRKESDYEDLYPHIEIFYTRNLNLESYSSLEESLKDTIKIVLYNSHTPKCFIGFDNCSYASNGVLLLNIFHTKQADCHALDKLELQNNQTLLLKLHLSHNNEKDSEYVCNMLQQEIEQYSQLNNVEQNNIRLSLTRLLGFERLKFNSEDLEKYIQFKNEKLSNCTEEELNEQAEKFINPHNYPCYFKNEVFACQGAEIVKRIGVDSYSKAANQALNSQNPDTSLQALQVLALTAIGKSTRQ